MAEPPATVLQRLLARVAQVEPHEIRAVVTSFLLYFFVLGGYFAVRPVRETFGTILGGDLTASLYTVTWIASIALIPAYGWIVARVRRSSFLPWIYGFVAFALASVGLGLLIGGDDQTLLRAFFYVLISVLNLFIVSVFWSFLLELYTSGQSKRLFGVIAAGGTTGALAGPAITALVVGWIGNAGVLLLGAAMFVIAILCQRALLAIWHRHETDPEERGAAGEQDRAIGGNPFAGFGLVLRSPYLLGIALLIALGATINTLLYFQQLDLVRDAFQSTDDRTRYFARIDTIVQALAVVSQIFLTGRIATRLGLVVLLTLVPVAMIGGFFALTAYGGITVLALVVILRRAGEYAFVRLGREMLFSRLDKETKYKAKPVVDVVVYRGADAATAQVQAGLKAAGVAAEAIAYLGAAIALVWAITGFRLGRSHDRAIAASTGRATSGAATSPH